MELHFAPYFVRAYAELTPEEQQLVDKALLQLLTDPRSPGLRARTWDADLWYGRASRDLRFFFEVGDGYYLMRDVGHHDIERRY